MAPVRHLLPWNAPALSSAADWLLSQVRDADLSGWCVVLPSRRAGRRLEELLLIGAEARNCPLLPPRITTVGHLPELFTLLDSNPPASDIEHNLALAWSLAHLPPEQLQAILRQAPEPDDILGWTTLAQTIGRLVTELAGQGLSAADVARMGCQLPDFCDETRYRSRRR
jgi:hypothetical protein